MVVITVVILLIVGAFLALRHFTRQDLPDKAVKTDHGDMSGTTMGTQAVAAAVDKARAGRRGKVSLSAAGKTALAKYESAVEAGTNVVMQKQEEAVRKQQAVMLAAVKTPKQLLDYLRKTGDYDGAVKKLKELIGRGRESAIEEITKELSPQDSEDVLMFVGLMFADIGTAKAMNSLFSVFDILPENSDAKRDMGEIIATVTNTDCKLLMVEKMLSSADTDTSDIAQRALANMANRDVMLALLDGYLNAPNPRERELFADTVRHMRQPEMVPALKYIVDGERNGDLDTIGLAACDTLGIIGTREATECLIQSYVGLTNPATASAVCAAVQKVYNPESLSLILETARDSAVPEALRLASISALRNYDYGLVGEVLQEMANNSREVQIRQAAGRSLEHVMRYRARE